MYKQKHLGTRSIQIFPLFAQSSVLFALNPISISRSDVMMTQQQRLAMARHHCRIDGARLRLLALSVWSP